MPERIVKKYSNRRLYDTGTSKMITLEDLAEIIASGENVRVIDNTTSEDITNMTMAQIIVELEKKKESERQIADILRDLIVSGSAAMADFTQRAVSNSVSIFSISKEKIKEVVQEMVERGKIDKKRKDKIVNEIWKTLESSRRTFTEKIKELMGRDAEGLATRNELEKLEKKITSLEDKLSRLAEENE